MIKIFTCVSRLPSVQFESSTFPYWYCGIHRKLCRMRSKLWRVVCHPYRGSLEIWRFNYMPSLETTSI